MRRKEALVNFDKFSKMYPFDEFDYGVTFNSDQVEEVSITSWNFGTRISIKQTYPMGDNAEGFTRGSAMWTRGTLDERSKNSGTWTHWYMKENYEVYGQLNSAGTTKMYVRFA